MVALVQIVREGPDGFDVSIVPMARICFNHLSIVRSPTQPFKPRKIFLALSPFSYLESATFSMSLLNMIEVYLIELF